MSGIIVIVGFGCLTWCILNFTKYKSQKDLEHEVAHRGISL